MRLPRSVPRCFWSFATGRRIWSSFTSITAETSWKWYPELPASSLRNEMSFWKQEPP